MKLSEAQKLVHGLYRIYWKGDPDGYSLAAVGSDRSGRRWLAPTNWVEVGTADYNKTWRRVERADLIEKSRY